MLTYIFLNKCSVFNVSILPIDAAKILFKIELLSSNF